MATKLKIIEQNQVQKEVLINENFNALSNNAIFSSRNSEYTGLYYQYYGGNIVDNSGNVLNISDGQIKCEPSKTNYVYYNVSLKKMEVNQTGYLKGCIIVCRVICDSTKITSIINEKASVLALANESSFKEKYLEIISDIPSNNILTINQNNDFKLNNSNYKITLICKTAHNTYKINDEVNFLTDGKVPLFFNQFYNGQVKFYINKDDIDIFNGTTIEKADYEKWSVKLLIFR